MFKQDERFDVRATTTGGELFLTLLDRVSIDVGKISWKMLFAHVRQILTKLSECESKVRLVVYSITDVASKVLLLDSEDFFKSKTV